MNSDRIEFFPCTLRFRVNAVIAHDRLVMLDLERSPALLIFERADTATTGAVDTREPTPDELASIEAWVETLPLIEGV